MVVVGTGPIGRALAAGRRGVRLLSGREVLSGQHAADLARAQTVVHAAGPAGEQACRADAGAAFAMHYTLLDRLADWLVDGDRRQLVAVGTVAPDVGFYGPMKRAAIEHVHMRLLEQHRFLVVECGHVVGEGLEVDSPNAGVVARFIGAAVGGARIHVAWTGEQTIRYTPLASLVDLVHAVARDWPAARALSPVSPPVSVLDVARTCQRVVQLQFGKATSELVMLGGDARPLDYAAPTGEPVPVPPLQDVLFQWMRTMEVKKLL